MPGSVEKWGVFEARLSGPSDGNPFRDVELTAEFARGHRKVRIAGFYDGEDVYIIRFMPDSEGTWTYRTSRHWYPLRLRRSTRSA
jgi:hypothetical protein